MGRAIKPVFSIFIFSERKPLKGLIKKYKTPPQRRRKKKDDADESEEESQDESEGERTALNVNHTYQPTDSHNSFTLQSTKVSSKHFV